MKGKRGVNRVFRTICPGCYNKCGMLAHVNGSRIIKVKGDPEHPLSRGHLCLKGAHLIDEIYHPKRIKHPLRRVGGRGQGKWRKVSWDEALDIVSSKLQRVRENHGPLSICGGIINAKSYDDGLMLTLFLRSLGSPNILSTAEVCFGAGWLAGLLTLGAQTTSGPVVGADFRNSKCILIAGENSPISHVIHWLEILQAKAKGAKLIVVDPRYTESAEKSDIWLQIRPGTDTALALAMLNVVLNDGLYDRKFVEKWTNGPLLVQTNPIRLMRESDVLKKGKKEKFSVWDSVAGKIRFFDPAAIVWPCPKPALKGEYRVTLKNRKEVLCKPIWQAFTEHVNKYTPEVVEVITEVPAEKIRKAARTFAANKPSCFVNHTGLDHQANATQAIRTYTILAAVTGNVDVPGGQLILGSNPCGDAINIDVLSREEFRLPREVEEKVLGYENHPLWTGPSSITVGTSNNSSIIKAMLNGDPYPVKAFINLRDFNPLLCLPDSRKVLEAIKKLELFAAITDFITPTNEFADILLPSALPLEFDSVASYGNYLCARQKIVEPPGKCRNPVDIIIELEKKTSRYTERRLIPWDNAAQFNDYRLKKCNLNFNDLKERCSIEFPVHYKKYLKHGFKTQSGKIEIYSILLEEYGQDPFPAYQEPKEDRGPASGPAKKYPLLLINSREAVYYLSRPRFSWAREIISYPQLEIHAQTAKERGINNGDYVWIETLKGRCKHQAKVTNKISPNVVCGAYGWWFMEKPGPEHGCFETGINSVISSDPITDSIIGTPTLKGSFCEVRKA